MIKVSKDLDDVPSSLDSALTTQGRNDIISRATYDKAYNRRFKLNDIKEALARVYNGKCAFCERKIDKCLDGIQNECTSTVEHYRPKGKYYWLAFSWDNLIWCCYRCNNKKGDNFPIKNSEISYNSSFLAKIHKSSQEYNDLEEPYLIHPDFEDIVDLLTFENGIIKSEDERVKKTIEILGLDREDLNESRKKVIDNLINKIYAKIAVGEDFRGVVSEFIDSAKDIQEEFIALRIWILKNLSKLLRQRV